MSVTYNMANATKSQSNLTFLQHNQKYELFDLKRSYLCEILQELKNQFFKIH